MSPTAPEALDLYSLFSNLDYIASYIASSPAAWELPMRALRSFTFRS